VTNTNRYGYGSCPCRVASGVKKYDIDIICLCEYHNADVDEFGMCYCGLFVNEQIKNNPSQLRSIPERRLQEILDAPYTVAETKQKTTEIIAYPKSEKSSLPIKVWRCNVCGYLCARKLPPPICPICKGKADYFEQFIFRKTK